MKLSCKKRIIIIVCIALASACIYPEALSPVHTADLFFTPFTLTAIEGSFNRFYLVSDTASLYEEIIFLSNPDYPVRYFSDSKRKTTKKIGSIIELYGQKFFLDDVFSQNIRNGITYYPRSVDIMWTSVALWLFSYNGKQFLILMTPLETSDRVDKVCKTGCFLFDITDPERISAYFYTTISFNMYPLFSMPKNSDNIGFIQMLPPNAMHCGISRSLVIKDGVLQVHSGR